MSSFRYQAVSRGGQMLRGEIEAANAASVVAHLHAEGALPLHVAAAEAGRLAGLARLAERLSRRHLSRAGLAQLVRRLATLAGAGIPLESALDMSGSAESRGVVQALLRQLRAGARLGDAMATDKNSFPPVVVSMVRAGEAGGSLPATLARLSAYLQREDEARQAVRSALIYPVILLATAGVSVAIVFTAVLPALRPVIDVPGKTLPLPVQAAFFVSDALSAWWWAAALAAILAGLALRQSLSAPAGRQMRDRLVLRAPFLGQAVLRADLARFANTLGTLIAGGLSMPAALQSALGVVSNHVLRDRLEGVRVAVQAGAGLADRLQAAGLFPDLAVQMVRIGEATGQPDRMLVQLAEILDQDLRRDLSRALSLLVPLLTIVLGVMVAGIVASVMLAVLSINDLAQ